MLIPNQIVKMRWHPRNKKYYESLGYTYTKIGDEFQVRIEDLTKGAKCAVKIKCDYCGRVYDIKYQNYINQYSKELGDTCCHCKTRKVEKSNLKKYGVENVFQIEEVKEKSKQTNIEKYGVAHCSELESYKKIIREKAMTTMCLNGNVPTSSQQLEIYNMLKRIYPICQLNYPCGYCSLDCYICVNDIKIDIEYDGNYWHQDITKDIKRDCFIKSQGFKVLRIKSKCSVPSEEELIHAIDCLVKTNHSYNEIILDTR